MLRSCAGRVRLEPGRGGPACARYGLPQRCQANYRLFETKRLWALGNYSRFIAPQSRRVALTGGGALKASAYLGSDAQSLAAVVVNVTDEAVAATFEVPAEFEVAQRFETSDDHNLDLVEEGLPNQAMIFPPRSVNTVVLQKAHQV